VGFNRPSNQLTDKNWIWVLFYPLFM